MASKTLLTAVGLGVCTELARGPRTAGELRDALGLHERSARDFFDALVALGVLEREHGVYRNAPDADRFLDRAKPSYAGGILEMADARLYGFWDALGDGLRSGRPQNEARFGGDLFTALYADPSALRGFLAAMTGISSAASRAIARQFPFDRYDTFFDVGAAEGALPVQVALEHPHISGGGFDLPVVRDAFEAYVGRHGVQDRLRFQGGDFFVDALPRADVLAFGHVLHDWGLEEKQALLRKAYEALPEGGAVIVHEALIDDARRSRAPGLLMSLNMLIETEAGFDYTGADCRRWMADAGFSSSYVEHLAGPDWMIVGIK
jgi:hypothetical protein